MNYGFWEKLKKPFTVLAPMANVTDWAFRDIVARLGRPDVFYTEFISADGIDAVGKEKFAGELFYKETERPIVVQFFTSKPEMMEKSARLAVELGFDGVDINMGCPDKSVEKQRAGAALIKNPTLAKELIAAAKQGAGNLPVSVKTRLGFNEIETDTWISQLLETKIPVLTVHARTRKEMSAVPAHWDELGKISEMAKGTGTLIIGNGDVLSMTEVREKAAAYNLDGIMIGRGIFQNPWLFNETIDPYTISPDLRIKTMLDHCDNFEKLWSDNRNFDTLKRFFKIYINNWPGAKDLRAELMMAKSIPQVREIISRYQLQK
jgi:nifR3 family TIM-barrel protein